MYEMVNNIRSAIAIYGSLKFIKMYWDYDNHPSPSITLRIRSQLSASAVTLIDCPADGREGAAAKKMLGRSSPLMIHESRSTPST
jgi:hypothetical protein